MGQTRELVEKAIVRGHPQKTDENAVVMGQTREPGQKAIVKGQTREPCENALHSSDCQPRESGKNLITKAPPV